MNVLLRKERQLQGWSLDDVANRIVAAAIELREPIPQIDGHSVGRYERRERNPRPQFVRLFSHVFQKSPVDLGFVEPDVGEDEDVKRRTVLKGLAGFTTFGVGANPDAVERLVHSLTKPGSTDDPTIQHLEDATVALTRFYQDVRPQSVIGPANGHLNTIVTLLNGSLRPSQRQRLCSIAGETAALLGWLKWNLDDLDGAARHFEVGIAAAREADDQALGSYLVGCAACRPFYREKPDRRLSLLSGRSHGFTAQDATPATRAWLANLEAGGYALTGDYNRYAAAAERAYDLLQAEDAEPLARRPRLTTFDGPYFAEEQAACLLRLARPAEASRVVEGALPQAAGRIRLWMLVDLACAQARLGAPEAAARVGVEALTGGRNAGVEPVLYCIRELLTEDLATYRHVAEVQELDERLHSLAGI